MAASSAPAAVAATPEATPQEGFPSDAECVGKIFLLLFGNPGAGKSTTQSLYARKAIFPVGLGKVGGHTITSQFHPAPNTPEFKEAHIIQVDTPGIDDAKRRAQCCQQVVNALRVGGEKRMVFCLKADGLRINAIEFKMIHLVLNALDETTRARISGKFGVIVNKLDESICDDDDPEMKLTKGQIIEMLQDSFPGLQTKNIALRPWDDKLRGKTQAKFQQMLEENQISMDPQLKHFLNNMDSIMVPRECVSDLQDDEVQLRKLEEQLEQADEEFKTKTATLTEEHKEELRKLADEQAGSWALCATTAMEILREGTKVVVPLAEAFAPVAAEAAGAVVKAVSRAL